jgi:hypothetical protein
LIASLTAIVIADAMTLAAAPGRFQYGWVRGAASAAFIVGAVGAGQVIAETSLSSIVWMNGALFALAALAALWLPQNALDRVVAPRQANVRALLAAPGFLPLMALAALVICKARNGWPRDQSDGGSRCQHRSDLRRPEPTLMKKRGQEWGRHPECSEHRAVKKQKTIERS